MLKNNVTELIEILCKNAFLGLYCPKIIGIWVLMLVLCAWQYNLFHRSGPCIFEFALIHSQHILLCFNKSIILWFNYFYYAFKNNPPKLIIFTIRPISFVTEKIYHYLLVKQKKHYGSYPCKEIIDS